MNTYTVKAELIPQRKRQQPAPILFGWMEKHFNDPKIQKEFEIWQKEKKNRPEKVAT